VLTTPVSSDTGASNPASDDISVYKSIVSKSSVYSLSILCLRLTSFLLLPILTRLLTPTDYGVLELLDLTLYVFGSLVGVQLGQALFYFYSKAGTDEERNRMASCAMTGSLLLGILGIGLVSGYLLAPSLSRMVLGSTGYTKLFYLAFANLGLSVPIETGLSWYRVHNQARRYSMVAVGRNLLASALSLLFLIKFHQGVASIQWSAMVSGIPAVLFLSYEVFRRTGIALNGKILWQQARYAAPVTVSGIFMLVLHYGDRFFLLRSVSMAEIGIYSLAYKFGMLVSMVQNPFMLFWGSQMFRVVQGPAGDRIYIRVSTYMYFVLTAVAVALSLFVRPLMRLMANAPFHGAAAYVPVIAAAYVLRGLGDHMRSVFSIENRTEKYLTSNIISAASCLSLYAILIPRYGLWGASLATLGGFLVFLMVGLWQAQRIRYFALEYRRFIHLALVSGVCIGVNAWLDVQGFWLQIASAIVLFLGWWLLLAVTGFFDEMERRYTLDAIAEIKRRVSAFHLPSSVQ